MTSAWGFGWGVGADWAVGDTADSAVCATRGGVRVAARMLRASRFGSGIGLGGGKIAVKGRGEVGEFVTLGTAAVDAKGLGADAQGKQAAGEPLLVYGMACVAGLQPRAVGQGAEAID